MLSEPQLDVAIGQAKLDIQEEVHQVGRGWDIMRTTACDIYNYMDATMHLACVHRMGMGCRVFHSLHEPVFPFHVHSRS